MKSPSSYKCHIVSKEFEEAEESQRYYHATALCGVGALISSLREKVEGMRHVSQATCEECILLYLAEQAEEQ